MALALKQSFLPVVTDIGKVVGLFAIPLTTFAGTETTFNLSVGSVSISLKTLPTTNQIVRIPQYMAAVFTHAQSFSKAYAQYAEWIPIEAIAPSSSWLNNHLTYGLSYFSGILLTCLQQGFTAQIGAPIVSPPSVGNPAATMNLTVNTPFANVDGATFFDFNWVDIFKAGFPTKTPASIQVTAQPGQADLLAYIIMSGQPVVGQIVQNTVRIVKVVKGNIPTGSRVFTFRIFDQSEASPMAAPTIVTTTTGGTLAPGTYGYRVSAVINGNESIASAQVSPVIPSAPAAPTLGQQAGGAIAATTYFVKVTYVTPKGETVASTEASLAVALNNLLVVTSPVAGQGATGYNVYVSTTTGTETKQNATPISIGTNWVEPTSGLIAGSAAPGNTGSNALTWPAIAGATSYLVYGRQTMKLLKTLASTVTSYTDTGADAPGTQNPILNNYTDVTLTATVS